MDVEYFKTVIAVKFNNLKSRQVVNLWNDASFVLNYEKKSGFNYEISICDLQGDIKEISALGKFIGDIWSG